MSDSPSRDSYSANATANLSRLTKSVSSTANSLVLNGYNGAGGELSNGAYQGAMQDIVKSAKRPEFQKRLFSFSRHSNGELVKADLRLSGSVYTSGGGIPDELLRNIPSPAEDVKYSLFQGFTACEYDLKAASSTEGSENLLEGKKHKPSAEELNQKLEILEIRKELASNEIKEIDQRIEYMNKMRTIVFERIAEIERDQLQLETELNLGSDDDSEVFVSDDPFTENVQTPKRKSEKNRRKTTPILQQFYSPGSEIKTIQAHSDSVVALDLDMPFGTMVSSGLDDTVKVWNLSKGTQIGSLVGHIASVGCLQLKDNLVATGSNDATAKLWDISKLYKNGVTSEDCDDSIKSLLVEEDSALLLDSFEAHMAEVTALHFHDTALVTGSSDKTIRRWDLTTGKCVQTLDILWAVSQNAAANNQLFNMEGRQRWQRRPNDSGTVNEPFVGAIQCYDAALATGTADSVVRLWDLRTGQVHRSLVGHTGPITCLKFDENYLVTGSLDRSIRIWDLRTGTIHDAFAYEHPISSLDFDPRRIVSTNQENTVKIYDREIERHWTCGPGTKAGDGESAIINYVRYHEGYLVEGRQDGKIGTWAC